MENEVTLKLKVDVEYSEETKKILDEQRRERRERIATALLVSMFSNPGLVSLRIAQSIKAAVDSADTLIVELDGEPKL